MRRAASSSATGRRSSSVELVDVELVELVELGHARAPFGLVDELGLTKPQARLTALHTGRATLHPTRATLPSVEPPPLVELVPHALIVSAKKSASAARVMWSRMVVLLSL
jgi:hypothetical protein